MRLNLAPVAGNMPLAYFPSVAAHTQLMAPYYDDPDDLIASLASPQSMDDDALYEATEKAQAALLRWQNQFYELDSQIWRATKGAYQREPNPRKPRPAKRQRKAKDDDWLDMGPLLPPNEGTTTVKTARPQRTQHSKSAKRGRDDLTIDMFGAPDALEPPPTKRQRKPRTIFQGEDEPTLLLDADSAPVKNDMKRKRKPKEPEAVQIKREESMPPPAKRATRAQSVAKAGPVAPESSNHCSKGAGCATKEASVTPETTKSGGKDPKRSTAMKAAWAKRQAEGRNGRHGGAPLASTVAKSMAKKGGK